MAGKQFRRREAQIDENKRRFDRWYRPLHRELGLYALGVLNDRVAATVVLASVLARLYRLKDPRDVTHIDDWLRDATSRACVAYVAKHKWATPPREGVAPLAEEFTDSALASIEERLHRETRSGELRYKRGVRGGWMLKAAGLLFLVAMGLLTWRVAFGGGPSTDERVSELLAEPFDVQTHLQGAATADSASDAPDRFNTALGTLRAGANIELAIREFGTLEKAISPLSQPARWYLSLALWKNGDSIGARDYWQRIVDTPGHFMQAEARELLELSD
jgi:hypothetical protein